MTKTLTKTLGSALPGNLDELLATKHRPRLDPDQGHPMGEALPYWEMPAHITDDTRTMARIAGERLGELLEPAPAADVKTWLATLGVLAAGRMSAGEARAKLKAYTGFLTPVAQGVLTKETAEKAGRAFKWFPSYAEVAGFLAREEAELRTMRDRALRIAAWLPPPPTPKAGRLLREMSDDEIRALAEKTARTLGVVARPGDGPMDVLRRGLAK